MPSRELNHWIYLDHAATTPVHPDVANAMAECLTADGTFGNPSSTSHIFGIDARSKVEVARSHVAALIGAAPDEIVWTSGATESDNLAIFGLARYQHARGKHLITARTEHKAALDAFRQLEKEGFNVTWLKPDERGVIDVGQITASLTPATTLVSIMHVNNEIGVIQDLSAIGSVCRERGVVFHVDAAQSAGKLPIDVKAQCIDLLSLSAHKFGGPKGIGALYVRGAPPLGLTPLIFGGGQEQGLRSGTLPTHQIVGMGEAARIAAADLATQPPRLAALRARLQAALLKTEGVYLNGHPQRLAPHILNLSFAGVEGESLIMALQAGRLAVSSGAACSSAAQEASYVLRALGRSDALAQASVRFSLGRSSTEAEVDGAADIVNREVVRLRALSPAASDSAEAGVESIEGEAGSIEQAAWVRFRVQVREGRVEAATVKVYGCPQTLAAAEWVAERMLGKRMLGRRAPNGLLDPLIPGGMRQLAENLKIPAHKLGRLLVIEDAMRKIPGLWPSP